MSRRRGSETGDVVALAAFGGASALAALVWLWGGLSGVLFGRGWAPVTAGELLGVLTRLPAHLADPGRAWPTAARVTLPGAEGFYATLVLLAAAGVLTGIVLARLELLPRRDSHGAKWATGAELRVLRKTRRMAGTDRARLTLGRRHGRLVRAEQRHALVAFGPPQSGKSAALAVPALLEWQGPVIASSIKTDLLETTLRRRAGLGAVMVFDPFELAGRRSSTWSPLRGAGTWDGALEVAWRLASAAELDQRSVEGGDFWSIAAEQRLAPLLYAAAASGDRIDAVVRWVYGQDLRGLHERLQRLAEAADGDGTLADARAAYDAARSFDAQADRTRSSIEGTAQALLRAYRFERVRRSASSDEITPDALLDSSSTLYLVGDAKASKLLRPLFIALISEIVDRAYERATQAGGALERPLLLCLDEAGNVAPLPNLAEIASTAPSHNIQLVSIFHDLAQARSRYGRQAETVVNSHRARMLLPGVADLETLRYFSGLAGDAEIRDVTRTTGGGGATRSVARSRRPLVAPEALRQLADGEAFLLYGRLAPVRVRLRLWFRDRRLRRLAR
jgi:type IV secretion system protein VirD4